MYQENAEKFEKFYELATTTDPNSHVEREIKKRKLDHQINVYNKTS